MTKRTMIRIRRKKTKKERQGDLKRMNGEKKMHMNNKANNSLESSYLFLIEHSRLHPRNVDLVIYLVDSSLYQAERQRPHHHHLHLVLWQTGFLCNFCEGQLAVPCLALECHLGEIANRLK